MISNEEKEYNRINHLLGLNEVKLNVVCLGNSCRTELALTLYVSIRRLSEQRWRRRTLDSCASRISRISVQLSESHVCYVVILRR